MDKSLAIEHGLRLLEDGADILDFGAESTKPGSQAGGAEALSAVEEQARLVPVIEGLLKARPDALISVDTYKAETARVAIQAGAEIVNDVSGLTWDRNMADVCAELGCGVVLMHTRGTPSEWKTQITLSKDEVLPLVRSGLEASLTKAVAAGVSQEAIMLDPGYGFGKRFDENYWLLARQAELLSIGRPLLAGLSRKSFLAKRLSGLPEWDRGKEDGNIEDREIASVAGLVTAILHGASIVRVHNVQAAVQAAAVADSVLAAR